MREMKCDDRDLPDLDWSEQDVPREKNVAGKWMMGLSSLAVLIALGVAAASAIGIGAFSNVGALLFGPFVLLGQLL